jgi:hypothetical protein
MEMGAKRSKLEVVCYKWKTMLQVEDECMIEVTG